MEKNPFDQFDNQANTFDQFDAATEKPAPPSGAIRRLVGDKALGFASGAIGATKAIADVAGAGNRASQVLSDIGKGVDSYLSPEAKADQQEQSGIMAESKGKGTWEGIKAGARAFGVAPVQTAVQGLGSVVPILAGTAFTGGALPAAAAGAGIGAAMGAGTAKGAIFDEIKKRSLDAGMGEAEATAAATKAQEYGGANTDQIALGGVLGTADALTGVAGAAGRMARGAMGKPVTQALVNTGEQGILRRMATGVASEIPLEAAQGGQEQIAANLAAQRAGYQAGTFDNVASNATLEALASAGPGAAFGALEGGAKRAEPTVEDTTGGLALAGDQPPEAAPVLDPATGGVIQKTYDPRDPNSRPPLAIMPKPEGIDYPEQVKPSARMGIDPAAWPISSAAALAVDSGAHQTELFKQAEQAAIENEAKKPDSKGTTARTQTKDSAKSAFKSYEEAQSYITEQKQRGTSVQALPLPQKDGSYSMAMKGTPDYTIAEFHKKQMDMKAAGVLDGDILTKSGDIFAKKAPAVSQPGQAPQAVGAQPAGPAAGVPAAGTPAVQADGAKPSREVADAAGIATSVLGEDMAAKNRFADFADAHAGKPAGEVQSLLAASEFGPKLAGNELAQISDQISKSGSGVASQARANAAPQVEASDSQKLANKIKFQKIRVEQAGAAVASAQDVDQFGLPIENGPKKQAAKARLQKAEADLAALESTQPPANNNARTTTSAPAAPAAGLPAAGSGAVQAIDDAAHAAATSPLNDLPQPTDAQKKAGNYAKGHVMLGGLDLSIENPAGSVRSGKDNSGKAWSNTLQHHYGYIKGTMGNDKDHVDLFVKPETPLDYSGDVYVIDQVHPETGKFDEHKVMVGFPNALSAKAAYHKNYAKGWKGMKAMTPMPFSEFKAWVKDGPKNKPLATESIAKPATKTVAQPTEKTSDQAPKAEQSQTQPEAGKTAADIQPAAGPGVGDAGEGAAAKPTSLREAIERKQNEPTTHAGLKIYPIKIKVGDKIEQRWGVQTPRNAERERNGERQIGGDPLSDTLDGAKKLAEQEVATAKDQQERSAAHEAEAAAAQAKKDANKGKSILQRRADALLDKQHTYPPQAGLGQGTRREAMQKSVDQGRAIVERMVLDTAAKHRDQTAIDLVRARGYILGLSNENIPVVKQGLEAQARMKANQYEKPEYRVYDSAKTDGGFYEITKTEFDYAKSLEKADKAARQAAPNDMNEADANIQNGNATRELSSFMKNERDAATRSEKVAEWRKQYSGDHAETIAAGDISRSDYEKLADLVRRGGVTEQRAVEMIESSVSAGVLDRFVADNMKKKVAAQQGTPTHQDPGEKPEAATAPVIAQSLAKAGKKEQHSQKEMRLWLLGEIDKAMKLTEDYADYQKSVTDRGQEVSDSIYFGKYGKSLGLTTAPDKGMITFDVPGDGKFKIRNSLRGLMEFRAKVEGKSGTGFTDKPTKPKGLPATTGVAKGSSNQIEALSNMLEELDFEAAVDYARETGVSLNDAKVPPHIRDQLTAYLKDGTLPPAPFSPTRYWEYQASSRADKDGNPIREASLTKEIGADTYIANVTGTNATGFTFTVTKGAETFEKKSGTFRTFSDALQGAESKIASIQPEVVKPKDTGWNMRGTGYAGKRYKGRNITLDDGREVVARIYENAGQYEEAEVKVDGKRVFAKTDRYKAEKLADDFIKTLTVKQVAAPATVQENPSTAKVSDERYPASPVGSTATGYRITGGEAFTPQERINHATKQRDMLVAESKSLRGSAAIAPNTGSQFEVRNNRSKKTEILAKNTALIDAWNKEIANQERAQKPDTTDEPLPAVTEAQARKQFEWRNMGQKDGTKSHLLFFFEREKDKGTGAAMGRGEVSLYPGSSGWQVDGGDGTRYKSLADAKAAAIDLAIPILQDQGYILKPAQAATAILDAANVTGKERIDALKDVKKGDITPEELQAAYPAKESDGKPEFDVKDPPTFDYRIKERRGLTLLIPPVGKAFDRQTRESLRDWAREAGFSSNILGDNEVSVSQLSGGPTLDYIVDGVDEQRIGNLVAKEKAQQSAKPDDSVKPESTLVSSEEVAIENVANDGTQESDGIRVYPGKGPIKDKFLSEVDGDGVPGGPFSTQAQAHQAAENWRAKKAERATANAQERARRDALAARIKRGSEPTAAEIKSLDLNESQSDVRWFFPTAANLFGLTSRQIRPLVSVLIRKGRTDMGTEHEFVPTKRGLMAIGNALADAAAGATEKSTKSEGGGAKIEDFGEKIGGARKDRWKERGLNLDDLDAMTEAEGAELATKANVWKPDYEAMSEASEPVTAAMVKTIYDQLAAKPKKNTPEGRRQYVQMMRIVRDVLTEADGPEAVKNAYQEIRKRAGLNTLDPKVKADGRELLFSVYKGRSDPFVMNGADLMKVKKMVEDGFPAKGEPWKTRLTVGRREGGNGTTERGIEMYMELSAEVGTPLTREQILGGFYRVSTKDNKTVAFAASKADAEAAAATVYERDMKGKKDGKPEPVRPNLDELKRENLPRRIDRDVTSEDFVRDLGFRGVEFGLWSAQDERQRILNMAYDGLMDLAEIMGVPPKAMSLNGTLGMAFGARGGGRFAAHYEPGKLVINMTKIRGGGSMAHEWAHAMDHYFGELGKADAYTTAARGASGWYSEDQYLGVPRTRHERVGNEWKAVEKMRLDNLRPEMAAAFDEVMRALFSKQVTKAEMVRSHELDLERTEALARNETQADLKAMYQNMAQNKRQALNELRGDPEGTMYAGRGRSDYASQAQALSGKSENGYWTRPTEMFARAFESWVFDRVTAMGVKSDYLVHGVEEDRFAGGAYRGNPYPTGEERARINAAFDKLAQTIKTKETDKGVAMFSRSFSPAARSQATDVVERQVARIKSKWKNAPKIIVAFDMADERIHERVRAEDQRQRSGGAGTPEGFYYGGTVYLMSSQLKSPGDVQRVLFHETLGHFGLRGTFGDGLKPILQQIATFRKAEVDAKIKEYGLRNVPGLDREIAAEEVLAEMAQNTPEIGFVKRAIAMIRTWLRENGFSNLTLTDDEIITQLILPARAFVEQGGKPKNTGGNSLMRSLKKGDWYSELSRQVMANKQQQMPAGMWASWIDSLKTKGVKPDEIEWSGVQDWLKLQTGKVTKDQITGFLDANGVKVTETVLKNFSPEETGETAKRAELATMSDEELADEAESAGVDPDNERNLVIDDIIGIYLNDGAENEQLSATKYEKYTLPGGENYREVLLTLPERRPLTDAWRRAQEQYGNEDPRTLAAKKAARAEAGIDRPKPYTSSHWDQPNVLAHIRVNDRVDADGRKVLFIEELQSDFGQQAKKEGFAFGDKDKARLEEVEKQLALARTAGDKYEVAEFNSASGVPEYWVVKGSGRNRVHLHQFSVKQIADVKAYELNRDDSAPDTKALYAERDSLENRKAQKRGVPLAPFVDKTDKWLTLSLKRIVKMAVDGGYDKVAFVNGKQSADRYALSSAVDTINWRKNGSGTDKIVSVETERGNAFDLFIDGEGLVGRVDAGSSGFDNLVGQSLDEIVGKDFAGKILSEDRGDVSGEGLDIGGDGMKTFYDAIVPNATKALLKKLGGGKMETVGLATDKTNSRVAENRIRKQTGEPLVDEALLDQPGFTITPAMQEKAAGGMPMFSRGTNEPMTNKDVVGNQGGRSADDTTPGPVNPVERVKQAAHDTFTTYQNRTGVDGDVASFSVDDNYTPVPYRAGAAAQELRNLGWEIVRGDNASYASNDASHYFEVRKLVANNPEYGPEYVTAKVRVSNHGNTTKATASPDVNIAPDEDIVWDIEEKLNQKITDEGYELPVSATSDARLGYAIATEQAQRGKPSDGSDGNPTTNESTAPDSGGAPMFSRSKLNETLKNITVTDIKARTGNKLADYRGLGLQFLGGRQIVDLYGKDIPQLNGYTQMVQQMSADANEVGAQADKIATGWANLKDERQLAELMHDATLAQIDPAKPLVEGDNPLAYGKLNGLFKALSDDAKKVYREARDAYEEHYAQVRDAIRDKIERSEMSSASKAAMLERMDGEFFDKIKGVYFPLARFGKYVVVTRGPTGVVNVSRAETLNEAQATRELMRKAYPSEKGFMVGKVIKDKEFNASRDAVGRGFLKELFGVLDEKGMGEELQDAVNQLYLASMPDLSWAKHGIHRKGTPGFSQDARRAFAQNMFHGARYLAKLRYADQLADKLTQMEAFVESKSGDESFDQPKARDVLDELVKRHDSLMNPKSNPLSTALTSFGFVFHMGLSPASAIVNLSGTAMVAYPIMGAKWGFDKAATALMKAGKEAATHKNDISQALNADEKRAYDAAVKAGTIDVTAAHDLAGIAQGEDAGVMWKLRPVMKWASFLFHHAERFNRQITFVAAYRLARETGANPETAFEQATKATYDGHFDYAASNRPRVMQGPAIKVITLFKQYGQNMVYTLTRQAQQAMNAETPEQRRESRKALAGLLVMHAAGAGVLGLPLVGTLLAAASMIGGSDDEPWDAEVALRNMLADAFGQKPAEVMARGLSRLTPWDISGRVGLDKLILPDIQEGLEGQRLGESVMAAALGPVAGIGINVTRGMQEISEGHLGRGIETMMPAAFRAPLKALRYEMEGAKDKTGVMIKDEVGLAGVAGQALGFSPSEVRNATEGRSAIYAADKRLMARRSELMAQYAQALIGKDTEGVAEAMAEIRTFNEKNPNRRINGMQLAISVKNRNRRVNEAADGVYLPKKRRDMVEEGRFAVPQ